MKKIIKYTLILGFSIVLLFQMFLEIFPLNKIEGCYSQTMYEPFTKVCFHKDGTYKQFVISNIEKPINIGKWRSYIVKSEQRSEIGLVLYSFNQDNQSINEVDVFPSYNFLGQAAFRVYDNSSKSYKPYIKR